MCWSPCLSLLACGLLLGGCMTAATEGADEVRFSCERDRTISVIFSEGSARVRDQAGLDVTLPQSRTGSGFLYESATHSIRGKGDDLTFTIGRMTPMACTRVR